jgi:hypothetical protein
MGKNEACFLTETFAEYCNGLLGKKNERSGEKGNKTKNVYYSVT